MGFLSDHPHTAVTDAIVRVLESSEYSLEVELPTIVDLIKTRERYEYEENQEEASRCIRKKLKYGNSLQQARALDLLNLFVSQGIKFTVMYNDTKLLERLGGIAFNTLTDSQGRKYNNKIIRKAQGYLLAWYRYIDNTDSRCYSGLVNLGRKAEKNYKPTKRSKIQIKKNAFMDDRADDSYIDAVYRVDLSKERPKIKLLISDALAAAVSLQNSLIALPRGMDAADDLDSSTKFEKARSLRRKVLRYLQLVMEGDELGSLIHANDELVKALSKYDELSGVASSDDYSPSDPDESTVDNSMMEASSIATDPFGDHNRI